MLETAQVMSLPRAINGMHHCSTSATVDLSMLTRLSGRLTALTLERRRDGQSEALADALPRLARLRALVLLDSGVRMRDVGLPARGGRAGLTDHLAV